MAKLESQLILSLIDRVTAPVRALTGTLDRLTAAQARNSARLDAMRGRMVEAGAVAYALARAVSAPIRAATEFETVLEDAAQKIDLPADKLQELGSDIRKVARDTTQSARQMAEAFDILAGKGARQSDALTMLEPIGKAATAYRADINDLANASYAALDNLKIPANQLGQALDIMAEGGKAGSFEISDLAKHLPSLGAAYQGLGQTGVEALADLTAAAQVVRTGTGSSDAAGTNLANILQKINAPQTVKAFKKMGVNLERELKRATEHGLSPIEAIAEITNQTLKGDLSKLGYLFSDAQVQQGLRPLLQNLDMYREIRAQALAAQGTVSADYQRRLKTGAIAGIRFANAMENINTSIGAALLPAVAQLGESLVPLIDRMATFAEQNPRLTQTVVALTAGLVGLRVAAIAAQFGLLWMKGGLISAAIAGLRGLQGAGAVAALALTPVTAAFRGLRTAMIGYAAAAAVGGHGAALSAMGSSLLGLLNPLRLVTAAMHTLKFAVIGTGIGAVLVGIAMAGTWIYNNWTGISTAFEAFKGAFMRAIEPVMPTLQPVINGLSWLWDTVAGLLGPIDEMNGGWAAAGIAVGKFVGEAIVAVVELPGKIVGMAGDMLAAGGEIAQAMWEGVKSGFMAGLAWMQTQGEAFGTMLEVWRDSAAMALSGLPEKLQALVPEMLEAGKALGKAIYDGVAALISELASYIKNSLTGALSSVSNYVSGLASRAANFVGLGGGSSGETVETRASGGPVRAGRPYLIGERGPELMVPQHSGYVVPNHALSGIGTGAGAPASTSGRGGTTVDMSGWTIYQQPGESADRLADRLAAKVQDMLAGTFSDGAYA